MSFSYVNAGSGTVVASGNAVLDTEGAGWASGDLVVATLHYRGSANFTVPSGWTLAAQETSGNIDSTLAGALCSVAIMYTIRGATALNPTFARTGGDVALVSWRAYRSSLGGEAIALDTVSQNTLSAVSTTATAPSLTAATTGELLVMALAGYGTVANLWSAEAAATEPLAASWTEYVDSGNTTGADISVAIAGAFKSSAGATGAFSATHANSTRHTMVVAAFRDQAVLNNYTLTADVGSYVITGQSASLLRGFTLSGETGSYTISGQAAAFSRTYILGAETGSYAISGQGANLLKGSKLTAEAGSYVITGQSANMYRVLSLTAETGSYTISGKDAAFTRTYVLDADTGSYVLTGQAATLKRGLLLTGAAGAYSITGQSATLSRGFGLVAETGSYTVSGQAADLKVGRVLPAAAGSYTLSGQAAGLTYTPNAGAYTLVADTGVYTVTGQAAALTYTAIDTHGGGWVEHPDTRKARKGYERQKRDAWKRLERDLEDAYAEATGQPRKAVRPAVREALSPRDPARVKAIAQQLVSSGDARSAELTKRIEARLAEIAEIAVVMQAEQIAAQQRAQDEENAIIALLLAA